MRSLLKLESLHSSARSLTLCLIAAAATLGSAVGCGSESDVALPAAKAGNGGTAGSAGASGGSHDAGPGADAKHDGTLGQDGQAASGGAAGAGTDAAPDGPGWCNADNECAATPDTPYCVGGTCMPCEQGNPQHACKNGFGCCSGVCMDVQGDPANCGECGTVCNLPNATAGCVLGTCAVASCQPGFDNCDLDASNGCEGTGGCACTANATEPCYSGPAGTQGVGACMAGARTCNASGTGWSDCVGEVVPAADACTNAVDDDCDGVVNNGYPSAPGCVCVPNAVSPCYTGPAGTEGAGLCHGGTMTCLPQGNGSTDCEGEVLPTWEVCANGIDEDCTGVADDSQDADGDGYTVCGGDCCDKAGTVCGSPALVNPGAIEVQGDNVDNNCNGQVDESPVAACSNGTNFTTDVSATKALALLNSMELCQVSQNGSWGIMPGSYSLTRASGTGVVNYTQVGILQQFGTHSSNLPRAGSNFAVLSSGHARDANDPDATSGTSFSFENGTPPADFVAPHAGALPKTSPSCPNGSGANDSVRLRVQLKVPSNANSLSFQFRFFSQEYTNYTCTQFNDFFITMLDSAWKPGPGQTPIPADKNICFDSKGGYISVNTTQFFTVCAPKTGYPCPDGTAGLTGTGYSSVGGSTPWLTTTAPVVPGELITLRFIVWDTSDMILDSLVLIDNFRWSATPSDGPITGQ